MGSFANSILTLLLGWLQRTAAFLWEVATQEYEGGIISGLGAHWLYVTVVLCLIGMTVDMVVYLIRWRPLEVWRSFFRRINGRKNNNTGRRRLIRRWVYADGSSVEEQVGEVTAEEAVPADPVIEETKRPRRRAAKLMEAKKQLHLAALLIGDDKDEQPIFYQPAPPARNKAEAFQKPCYPPGWNTPKDSP